MRSRLRRWGVVVVLAVVAALHVLAAPPAQAVPGITRVIYDGELVMTVSGTGWSGAVGENVLGGDIHFAETPDVDQFGSLSNARVTHVLTEEEALAGRAQVEVPLSTTGRWYVQVYIFGSGPLGSCGSAPDCSSNIVSVRNVVPNDDDDPAPSEEPAERFAGENRYRTAVAIARVWPTSPVVYLATGEAFADALAAGPAAAHEGAPILLVSRDTVDDAVTEAIRRLQPERLVIIGGTAAISTFIEESFDQIIDVVDRVAGVDRYETAAALAAYAFPDAVEVAYLASGRAFPDPVIAGAAAALADGPLLLVDGTRPIEASVAAQLQRLDPDEIVAVGPDAALAPALVGLSLLADVRRVGQDDIYERSAALWDDVEPPVFEVILATANGFADALAGTPYAALEPLSYLMLSEPACVPAVVLAQLERLEAERLLLLGGTAALSDAVAARTPC